ncbi:hypothetical protein AGMMS50212_05340 [Spirochaetia bacterium]|nr:hypothetical protein AGMMS50212_05340 [Spirochaetia bacterium]
MRKLIFIGALVFLAFLGSATFLDLWIDKALFNPQSTFGAIFAVIGLLPQIGIIFIAPAMVWAVFIAKRKDIKPTGILILIFVSAVSVFRIYNDQDDLPNVIKSNPWIIVLFFCALVFVVLPFAKKHPHEVLQAGIIAVLVLFAGRLILDNVKMNWGRQRFFTMTDPDSQFTRWFLPQGKAASDSFKSFPSGHSFSAMLSVWVSLIPVCIFGAGEKARKWSKIIVVLALLFGFTTMFSRLVLGMHFLSDVTCGAVISLACFVVFKSLIDANYERIRTLSFKAGSLPSANEE